MGTKNNTAFVKTFLSFALVVFVSPFAKAGSMGAAAAAARSASMEMQASAGCNNGLCGLPSVMSSVGSDSLKSLLHLANVIARPGRPNQDPREYGERRGVYAPIGVIDVNIPAVDRPRNPTGVASSFRSTAFLVSPCYIQTAYHTVFDRTAPPSSSQVASFSVGQGAGNSFKHTAIRATPERWGSGNGPGDWVLLRLDNCVGRDPEIGWMEVRPGEAVPNMNVQIAGVFEDRGINDSRFSIQRECNLRSVSELVWRHDCAGRRGASGAPIFSVDETTGAPIVFAMHTNGAQGGRERSSLVRSYADRDANLGLDLRGVYLPDVYRIINNDIKAFGQETAGDSRLRQAMLLNPQIAMARSRAQVADVR